ncbi:hypothetical protein HAX54_032157, partial [Datura stramonium]|nr:hypothetical protein [Datura stramonium]
VNMVEISLKRAIKEGSELWNNFGGITGQNQVGALVGVVHQSPNIKLAKHFSSRILA